MAASIIDSSIFQGIFTTDEMRQVWSDENRTACYVEIERALAVVQGRLGLIPQEAADEGAAAKAPARAATEPGFSIERAIHLWSFQDRARDLSDTVKRCLYRGALFAKIRCSVRRCMFRRRAVSETLRLQSS